MQWIDFNESCCNFSLEFSQFQVSYRWEAENYKWMAGFSFSHKVCLFFFQLFTFTENWTFHLQPSNLEIGMDLGPVHFSSRTRFTVGSVGPGPDLIVLWDLITATSLSRVGIASNVRSHDNKLIFHKSFLSNLQVNLVNSVIKNEDLLLV